MSIRSRRVWCRKVSFACGRGVRWHKSWWRAERVRFPCVLLWDTIHSCARVEGSELLRDHRVAPAPSDCLLSPITTVSFYRNSSNEHNFFIVKLLLGNNTSIRYSSLRWCRTLSVCDSKRFPEAKRNFFGDSKLQHLKIQRKNHNIVTMFAYKILF